MGMRLGSGGGSVARQIGRIFGPGTIAGLSEGELVARVAERGDSVAFEAILALHGPMVLTVCRRALRDAHEVEDAFQATFLILLRRAGSIRRRERLGPWLYGVARRVTTRARHDSARRPDTGHDAAALAATSESSSDLERREAIEALHEEIGRLPEKYRAPIVLCHLEGLTHDEAAARLRWPVGTVRGRLFRGRDRLRDRLARRGFLPSAALWGTLAAPRDAAAAAGSFEALAGSTIEAAARVAAGQPIVRVLSARAASWTKGVMNAMLMNQLKWAAGIVAAVGFLTVGSGALALQLRQQGDVPTEARPSGEDTPKRRAAQAINPSAPVETPVENRTDPIVLDIGPDGRPFMVATVERAEVQPDGGASLELQLGEIEVLQMEVEAEKQELQRIIQGLKQYEFQGFHPGMSEEDVAKQLERQREHYQSMKKQYLDDRVKLGRATWELHQGEIAGDQRPITFTPAEGLKHVRPPVTKVPSQGGRQAGSGVPSVSPQLERRLDEIEGKLDRLLKAVEGGKDEPQ